MVDEVQGRWWYMFQDVILREQVALLEHLKMHRFQQNPNTHPFESKRTRRFVRSQVALVLVLDQPLNSMDSSTTGEESQGQDGLVAPLVSTSLGRRIYRYGSIV